MRKLSFLLLLLVAHSTAGESIRFPFTRDYAERNWGLYNKKGNHVHAREAEAETKTHRNVTVAVIDTGVDFEHPVVMSHLWSDRDGFHGYNFVNHSRNQGDMHGHGTHVTGIIEMASGSRAKIMSLKYYSDANSGLVNVENTVEAIDYAVAHGAKIINYSGGGPEFNEKEFEALTRANAKGILFVAAAGNDHEDTRKIKNFYYPAAYNLPNIISVASTDINDELCKSSNWGNADVAAPGENIYSSLPYESFGFMTGTSQATAFVTGEATLLLSENPHLTARQLKKIILKSVDKRMNLRDKVRSGGRVNEYTALKLAKKFKRVRKKKNSL